MRLSVLLLCAFMACIASHACAETLVVSTSGTFSNITPTSAITAPGGSFFLSFDVSSQPGVFNVNLGNDFSVVPSSFTYSVNGLPSSAPLGSVTFFNENVGGLFSACFFSACPDVNAPDDGLIFAGNQAYSGPESSPILLPGTYPLNFQITGVDVNGLGYAFDTVSPVTISPLNTPPAVPEPSSFVLLGTGLLGMAGALRRKLA